MPYANNQGVRIHYQVEGEGPPLVLLHGRAASLEQWRVIGYVDRLKQDYRLILIDARGHGASDKPHDPHAYRMALWVADVVAVLDDLGIDKAHFLGYSMGGNVGFAIAKYAPERLRSLIIGGHHPYESDSDGPNPREKRIQLLRKGMEAWVAVLANAYGSRWTPSVEAVTRANDLQALIAQYMLRERVGLVDALPSLTVPCLIFVGENDGHFAKAKEASEMMPSATFVSLPGLNHIEAAFRIDLVYPHITAFLESVEASMRGQTIERRPTMTIDVFTGKAARYAKYRWDYAPQAIQTIFDVTGISERSVVADIGAGTGILTRHFVGKVKQILAVEPNADMRQMATNALDGYPSCHIINGRAEATTLADDSVDLITTAQALGWFEPQPTRTEFLRILRPGGWLVELYNHGTDDELRKALEPIFPPETDTATLMKSRGTPMSFYYGHADFIKRTFAFTTRQTWEAFIGALSTSSYAPHENSALYADFERAARRVFDRFNTDGILTSSAVTELCLGHMTP